MGTVKGDLPSEDGESNCELQVETEFARQKRQGERKSMPDSTSDSREENHCTTALSEETRV